MDNKIHKPVLLKILLKNISCSIKIYDIFYKSGRSYLVGISNKIHFRPLFNF